jgi:hypothetical protein
MSPVASRYIALEVSPGFAKANEEQMNAAGTAMRRAHEARVFMDVGSREKKGEAIRRDLAPPSKTRTRDAGHHGFAAIRED